MSVLLVTGGSRGIGAAIARRAARAGFRIAVNYSIDRAAADEVAADIAALGGEAIVVGGDVSREADVVAMFDAVARDLGPLTALVNSAGISTGRVMVRDFDGAAIEKMLGVNVVGTMLCCREAMRRMGRDAGGSGGAIVNISSMAATIGGRPGASAYAASKAAVDAFTIGFAKEAAPQGVRVNAVRPGMTLTDMTQGMQDDPDVRREMEATIAMNRIAEADEIAAPVVWLLSDEASFVSGCRLDASGGGFVIGTTSV